MKFICSFATMCLLLFPILIHAQSKTNDQNAGQLRTKANEKIAGKTFAEAIALSQQALEEDRNNNDSLGMAQSLYVLTRANALSGQFEQAKLAGQEAAIIFRQLGHAADEFKANSLLSWAYFMLEIPVEQNMQHQRRQLTLAEQLNDSMSLAMVYNNFGYDATVYGSIPLDSAIYYTNIANNIYAKKEHSNGRWYTLMNLTWQHRLKADYEQSLYFGKLAVAAAVQAADRHAIIEARTNLGETLLRQQQIADAAIQYMEAKKEADKKTDRDKYVFDVYYARYLWQTENRAASIGLLEKAVDALKSTEVFYEMLGRSFLAAMYYELQQNDLALQQIGLIEDASNKYVSFESRFNSGLIKLKIRQQTGNNDLAKEQFESLVKKAKSLGADHLLQMVKNV